MHGKQLSKQQVFLKQVSHFRNVFVIDSYDIHIDIIDLHCIYTNTTITILIYELCFTKVENYERFSRDLSDCFRNSR